MNFEDGLNWLCISKDAGSSEAAKMLKKSPRIEDQSWPLISITPAQPVAPVIITDNSRIFLINRLKVCAFSTVFQSQRATCPIMLALLRIMYVDLLEYPCLKSACGHATWTGDHNSHTCWHVEQIERVQRREYQEKR